MKLFPVKSTSMYPTIIEDDKIMIIKGNEFSIGDIIVYKNKGSFIAHRLIKIKQHNFFLKGDNNIKLEIISKNKVFGKVIFINKKQFKNNIIQKLIAYLSFFQTKVSYLYFENNTFTRRIFKVITNPILYTYYLIVLFK